MGVSDEHPRELAESDLPVVIVDRYYRSENPEANPVGASSVS